MGSKSLVQYFKDAKTLQTDIGAFTYVNNIGQGGNAHVLEFAKGNQHFAVKFIRHGDSQKLARFIDEYFCAAMLPTHSNIARSYHFDSVTIEDDLYSLIVMKRYGKSLQQLGPLTSAFEDEQEEKASKLFVDLCKGLHHLHAHQVIHRDLKPQNIFFDESHDKFVIGDLGIAHFNNEMFAKAAETKSSDRLANYLFSAPEQANSKLPPIPANDIYALAQVMQWYLKGQSIRGLGRESFRGTTGLTMLGVIDKAVEKCLYNNPDFRFKTIKHIADFVEEQRKPQQKDPMVMLDDFDRSIRMAFTKIQEVAETEKPEEIEDFINIVQTECEAEDLWYVLLDGGDNIFSGLKKLEDGWWLLNGMDEVKLSKLIVYRNDSRFYRSFAILLIEPADPFVLQDSNGNVIERDAEELSRWKTDVAVQYNGCYIDLAEVANGYYKVGGTTIPVTRDKFADRQRYLKPYAVLLVPQGSAPAVMTDRRPAINLLTAVRDNYHLSRDVLDKFLHTTAGHHRRELSRWD